MFSLSKKTDLRFSANIKLSQHVSRYKQNSQITASLPTLLAGEHAKFDVSDRFVKIDSPFHPAKRLKRLNNH